MTKSWMRDREQREQRLRAAGELRGERLGGLAVGMKQIEEPNFDAHRERRQDVLR